MKYPKNYLEEIKLRLKVSQVVGKTVKLKRRGKEFIGLSPFTNEKTPSFTVSDEKRFYHCFSSGEHGNIFDFLMKIQSLKFGEAVRQLALDAGMQPYRFSSFDLEKEKRYQTYKNILKDYTNYHHRQLILGKNLSATNYLLKRQVNKKIVSVTKGWTDAYYNIFLLGEADLVLSYTTSPAAHIMFEENYDFSAKT